MKKVLLILLLPLSIISCSKDEVTDQSSSKLELESTENLNDIELETLKSQKTYTLGELVDFIKEDYEAKGYQIIKYPENFSSILEGKIVSKKVENSQQAPTSYGPYTKNSTKILRNENKKVLLTNGDGGLATGVYFADVYAHEIQVTLPQNAIPYSNVPNPVGYKDIPSQELGITSFTQTTGQSTTFVAYTISLRVNYNAIGQYLGRTIPQNLPSNLEFVYGYVIL